MTDRELASLSPTALCRITIATDGRQVDVSVPADVPIALVLPDLVGLASNGSAGSTTGTALARIGQAPLRGDESLLAQGVVDGDLLFLTTTTAVLEPIVDDVASALTGGELSRATVWDTSARLSVTWACASALVAGACFALWWADSTPALVRAITALATAAVLLLCCLVAARTYGASSVAVALGGAAALLAFTGGALLIPDPQPGGVLFGCALAGAVAAIALRVSGRGESVLAAMAFLAILTAPAALAGTLTTQSTPTLAAILTITGLLGLTFAGRIAVATSGLPVPAMPGALAGDTDAEPDLPVLRDLQDAAARADAFLTGLVRGATLAIALGATLCAIGDEGISWIGGALAGVAALLLALRARIYTSAAPAAAVLVGATGIVVAVAVGIALRTDLALVAFAISIAAAALALVAGAVVPGRRFSPPARRSLEILELVVIAAAVPLACWVAGLFDALTLR